MDDIELTQKEALKVFIDNFYPKLLLVLLKVSKNSA